MIAFIFFLVTATSLFGAEAPQFPYTVVGVLDNLAVLRNSSTGTRIIVTKGHKLTPNCQCVVRKISRGAVVLATPEGEQRLSAYIPSQEERSLTSHLRSHTPQSAPTHRYNDTNGFMLFSNTISHHGNTQETQAQRRERIAALRARLQRDRSELDALLSIETGYHDEDEFPAHSATDAELEALLANFTNYFGEEL